MINKIFKALNIVLDYILTVLLAVILMSFGYWFTLQSQAQNTPFNPAVSFQSVKSKITPSIASGVNEKKSYLNSSNSNFEKSVFQNTACSSASKPEAITNKTPDFDDGGLYSASKDEIELKYSDQNTFIYGQELLDQNLINYMLCVIDITASTTALSLQLDFPYQSEEYLNQPTRIIIYDNLEDYTKFFQKAYGQKLGDTTPWGLYENGTISTFLQIKDSNQPLSEFEISDIKYRLTYNLSHEYFHQIFSLFRSEYTPFIEEGLAVYISGKVTNQILGYHMGCSFKLSQAKLALEKPIDLNEIELAVDPDQWYNSNNVSQNYALSFYYIKSLEANKTLVPFIKNFVNDPDFLKPGTDSSKLNPAFKGKLEKMIEKDKFDCSYIDKY